MRKGIWLFVAMFFSNVMAADSLGVVGGQIVDIIGKVAGEHAGSIYTALIGIVGWALTMFIQWVLKRIPTKWVWQDKIQDVGVSLMWRILARLFGKSILQYNMQVVTPPDAAVSEALAKRAAIDKAKAHLAAHRPIFRIEVK